MEGIKKHIMDFDVELTEKHLGIFGRSYITTACLLTYCSVLKFPFQGRVLPRGWMDIIVFGDTRCGKSFITEGLVKGIGMGEFFKCENASFAGLIGGLQQIGTRAKWDIVWGKIPLNHGKLLAADEMSSLSTQAIGDMSAVRSSGIAEVTKVQSGSTRAATRMIWLSNPRSEEPMSSYTYGIQALKELIGRPEDISRFDLAIAVATEDVSMDEVNQVIKKTSYSPKWKELRQLIKWAWQLSPGSVIFEEKATEAVLTLAKKMSKEYSHKIPLVEPNEQRIRLARVAVATAVRCFSEEGGKLIVKAKHVEFAHWFADRCYSSRTLGYKTMSLSERSTNDKNRECLEEVKEVLVSHASKNLREVRLLYSSDMFSATDVGDIFNIPRAETREICSTMLRFGCIVRKHNTYKKTKLGISTLEQILGGLDK